MYLNGLMFQIEVKILSMSSFYACSFTDGQLCSMYRVENVYQDTL